MLSISGNARITSRRGRPDAYLLEESDSLLRVVVRLVEAGLLSPEDWNGLAPGGVRALMLDEAAFQASRAALFERFCDRLRLVSAGSNEISLDSTMGFVEDMVAVTFEMASLHDAYVVFGGTVERFAARKGRSRYRPPPGGLDRLARPKYLDEDPSRVVEEGLGLIAETRGRIEWARRKIRRDWAKAALEERQGKDRISPHLMVRARSTCPSIPPSCQRALNFP